MKSRRRAFAGDDGPPAQRRLAPIVVVAMGSEWRRDDGVGMRVARSVAARMAVEALADCRVVTQLADPLDLLSHWAGAELAVILDATRSGLAPGSVSLIRLEQPVSRLAAESDTPPTAACAVAGRSPSSSHGLGLANVLRLARAVDRAPRSVVICGVEGEDFSPGSALSPAVEAAVDKAAAVVLELVEEALACA